MVEKAMWEEQESQDKYGYLSLDRQLLLEHVKKITY
jgi:hypothetical protein